MCARYHNLDAQVEGYRSHTHNQQIVWVPEENWSTSAHTPQTEETLGFSIHVVMRAHMSRTPKYNRILSFLCL